MFNCPICKLKKIRWATSKGFVIGKKAYCCMGCGFAGCICIPRPGGRKKRSMMVPSHASR